MAEQYKSGETLQQIGDEYGISRERVRQILAKHGVKRSQGGQARALADRLAEGVRLYKQGISLRAAAKSVGTSQENLGNEIDRLGIRREVIPLFKQHGTVQCYAQGPDGNGGCRCPECRKANTDYRRSRREANRT